MTDVDAGALAMAVYRARWLASWAHDAADCNADREMIDAAATAIETVIEMLIEAHVDLKFPVAPAPAASPADAAEGWVMVPRIPTPEMVAAAALSPDVADADRNVAARALCCLPETRHPQANDVLNDIARDYRVMISAAPSLPVGG